MTNVGIRHMMYADVCHIEIHEGKNEETNENHISEFNTEKSIVLANVDFKYNPHAFKKTLTDVSAITKGKVTAIVGALGSEKTTVFETISKAGSRYRGSSLFTFQKACQNQNTINVSIFNF